MPTVRVNGVEIYYEVHGEGEPLLFICGLSMDLTAFSWAVNDLSQRYRVIVFDNRGAGRSEKPDIPYTIEMMAEDTAGLLDALKVSRVNVAALSMGGRIALSLVLTRPDLVKSLILVSTGARVKGRGRRFNLALLEIPRRLGSRLKKYPQPNYAYKRQRDAAQGFDATERLGEIKVPTLILHGKKDRLAPLELAEEMHSRIPGSKIVTFDGGHIFLFWKQKEFLAAVTGFLEGSQPSQGP